MIKAITPNAVAGIRRSSRPLVALATVVLLAACSTATSTGPVSIAPRYDRSYVSDMAARGGMPLVVKGNPFPGDNGAFARQVATALTEAHFGPEFTVFADPDAAPDGSTKTVLIVNAERRVNSGRVCGSDSAGGGPVEGALDFTIAFCSGSRRLSSIRGRFTDLTGPEDRRIAEVFRQVAIQLYPSHNPDRNDRELQID